MTGFLERLEQQLIEAVERPQAASTTARPTRSRSVPVRAFALAAVIALVLAAVALAASGVLLPGSPVPGTPHLAPNVGLGVPAPGRSRLIANSTPDPIGGLPWSMRIVRTTRRLVCLQIGRLYHGQIGILGEQAAFQDDKRFHPILADAITPAPQKFPSICNPGVQTSSFEASGVPQSAELPKLGNPYPPIQQRRLYFGLLGPSAVSVTYHRGHREITTPVEPRTGAYLIVLPSPSRPPRTAEFGGKTGISWDEGRLVPEGALTAITYRTKTGTCLQTWNHHLNGDRCPHPAAPHSHRAYRRPVELHRTIYVGLHTVHGNPVAGPTKSGRPLTRPSGTVSGVYYEADISFTAPFTVNDALSGYTAAISEPSCGLRTGLGGLGQNIRARQVAHIQIHDLFESACGKRVTVEVLYHKQSEGSLIDGREVVVGRTSVARPRRQLR